ncbi:hypothetical protein L7F22_031698 [Adiantum nelumboides]|nr:hypothetical protein [Adiantum nelumboides]
MEVSLLWIVCSLLAGVVVAVIALHRRSLNGSGAIAGSIVLSLSFLAGFRYGALILGFFFSSSRLTKHGSKVKKELEGVDYKHGGQRNWLQVLVNSSIATVLSVLTAYYSNWGDKCLDSMRFPLVTGFLGGILGHYACCNGDTWSSELGVLSESQPRLITTMRVVQRGVNGAVTLLGLLAATAGGALIGLIFVLVGLITAKCEGSVAYKQWLVLPLGAFAGLFGSVCDSLLGATVQYSGFCVVRKKVVEKPGPTVKRITGQDILDNDGVNFVSVLITTIATAAISLYIF